MKDESNSNSNSESEVEVVNPGDCIGHWLNGDESCEQCEIEGPCKKMTLEIEGNLNESGRKENGKS